ncbi:MAG: response regulator transcription factor [Anaerolineae bacterium]|nr:response regulator transcription factor [Anaerolineae bacterium]
MNSSSKILIIDDEASLRQTLARILQQAGFEVTTAQDGEQGLSFMQTTSFELVFMDIRMPGMPGLEVLEFVRSQHPNLPVVLFTAQPDLNSAVEALRRGATDYLLKPLKPETIIERARTILAAQQKDRRRREIQAHIELLQAELKALDSENVGSLPLYSPTIPQTDRYLKRGALVLDTHARRVSVDERAVSLAAASFDFLLVLARHAPKVVDYKTLVTEAQGYQVDAREAQELSKWHIHNIRQAIEPDPRAPIYLFNVRGIGYRLMAD